MATPFPDDGTVHAVLSLATRAPSIYNTQPWRWRVDRASLHLYADSTMQLPNTDPDGRELVLSCGATLNHCVIALGAMGWQARVHRLPDQADPRHLATVDLSSRTPEAVDVALAAAIPLRRTDRRIYSPWPVPAGVIATMGAIAAEMDVTLRRVSALDKLSKIVKQAAREHATNHDYLIELTTWSGRYGSRAGVPARNTPEHDCGALIPGRIFASPGLGQPPGAPTVQDRALILAIGTKADDRLSQLRAGEAASALLLTATARGLASCPITEALEISVTRDAIRSEVFGSTQYPQILLRIGWPLATAGPLPATQRRSLSRVVDWSRQPARR